VERESASWFLSPEYVWKKVGKDKPMQNSREQSRYRSKRRGRKRKRANVSRKS
jgi:hypothetical protein